MEWDVFESVSTGAAEKPQNILANMGPDRDWNRIPLNTEPENWTNDTE